MQAVKETPQTDGSVVVENTAGIRLVVDRIQYRDGEWGVSFQHQRITSKSSELDALNIASVIAHTCATPDIDKMVTAAQAAYLQR